MGVLAEICVSVISGLTARWLHTLKTSFEGMRLCVLEHASYGVLGLLLDLPQVTFTAETLGIDLVNILRAGRPRGKPSVLGNHLDSTERQTVPRRCGKRRSMCRACKFRHADLFGRDCLQQLFLFGCRGRVDPLVEGHPQLARELIVCFAWVPLGLCGDFGGKQTENYSVLVCRPDRSVSPKK